VVIDVDGRGIRAPTRRGQNQHQEQIAFRHCTALAELEKTSFLRLSKPISCSYAPWSCLLLPMFKRKALADHQRSASDANTCSLSGGAIPTTRALGDSSRIRPDQTMRDASSSVGIRPCGVN
jgi:hypothetical protein